MITTVFGNKNSGKSEFAENLLGDFSGSKYYLATMRVLNEDDEKRVEKHRALREGKDFVTIEQDVAIVKAIDKIKWMETLLSVGEKKRAALLECIPTLIANEMFLNSGEVVPHEEVEKTVLFGIAFLKEFFDEIVIVSDKNSEYENEEYKKALDEINKAITTYSDKIENI